MAKYLFVYHGGGMAETEEQQAEAMAAWGQWFGSLGSAVVDGGNPVGPTTTVGSDGNTADTNGNAATGYSLIDAAGLEDAIAKAKGCPILAAGGSVEIAVTIDMS